MALILEVKKLIRPANAKAKKFVFLAIFRSRR